MTVLAVRSCKRLTARSIGHLDINLSFDKDDDDALDFVLATANLRATAYGIARKTRFQVKGIRSLFRLSLIRPRDGRKHHTSHSYH